MSYKQFVLFEINDQEFAVDINMVKTIEKVTDITRVPGSQVFVKGVVNLRGEVVPVIDTAKRLKLEQRELDDEARIIIVKVDDLEIGMIVDAASEVVSVKEEDIDTDLNYSKEIDESLVRGVGKIDDRIVVILDIRSVFKIS